jgi:LysM repeat protein
MDSKIKLLAAVSVIAVMTSGCSRLGYGPGQAAGGDGYSSTGSGAGQVARTGQVSRGGLFGQQRASTCAPCAANTPPKSTYTYKPAAKPVYKATTPGPVAGQHNQQYYIDKWNREQAQQKNKNTQDYTGYGNTGASNTTYYDYSSAAKTAPAPIPAPVPNVSASNKSIYTGSYQQPTYKPYQPTTYAGGSAGTTSTTAAATSGGGSSYVVKKGDTVFEVMRQTGVYWKDIISMNNLVAPAYTISPGQRLRLK